MRRSLALVLLLALATIPADAVNLEATPYLTRVFRQGEQLVYSLSWLGLVGGTATMTVTPRASTISITSVARSGGMVGRLYPVSDEIQSIVDRASFSTLRFQKHLDEKGRVKNELTTFDPARKVFLHEEKEFPYKPPIFDALSSIYYIRTLDLTPGKTHSITMIGGEDIYEIEAVVHQRERLRIDDRTFDTVLVEPKMRHGGIFRDEENRLLIWFTDDERRIPVRIRSELEFGSITASIRSARLEQPKPGTGVRSPVVGGTKSQ